MIIHGNPYRSIWRDMKDGKVKVIDQRKLPHLLEIITLENLEQSYIAIRDMYVRGAPLIGVTAAFGFAISMQENCSDQAINETYSRLVSARPTAVNLEWACQIVDEKLKSMPLGRRVETAWQLAMEMADDDVAKNTRIGKFGVKIIRDIAEKKTDGSPVSILTHCNAGWLATVDRGTATAPMYEAVEQGIDIKVWVDETRPRNQGAALTAWELHHNDIPNTLIVDNAGGHLMQHGQVDLVIVGSDRTTACGDVCNKIGTYLKALAAADNNVPFYAALPVSTIDFNIDDSLQIPIEERSPDEVLQISGMTDTGQINTVNITTDGISAANPAFDVTPARLVTGIITDKGVVPPERQALAAIKP
jgi:methylthioribose-1-phosphate isomerase